MKTIAFHTLGCKLNFAESSDMLRKFTQNGYQQVDFHQIADLYVINTCSVTQVAEKKCRNAIRQAINLNPNALIAVIGCFAQLRPQEIESIEGVDIILGNDKKHRLFEIITNAREDNHERTDNIIACSSYDRTRCFIKIQDGCDYFCSYCTIPFARGRSRSTNVCNVIETVNKIAAEGKKEIVLSGINIGTFGKNNGESLFELMQALEKNTQIERYRISSIEPNLLTEEIIDHITKSRCFLPHFHIPMQAGTDTMLRLMNRRYDIALFISRLKYIKSKMPHAFIASDVIVGFPQESDALFAQTKALISGLDELSALHVFMFSERDGTLAANLDGKIPYDVKKQRSQELQKISQEKKKHFQIQNIGSQRKVLWESDNVSGWIYGYCDNYIRVRKPYRETYANQIEEIKLTALHLQ